MLRASAVDLAVEARKWGVQTHGSQPDIVELAKQGVSLDTWRAALQVAKDRGALSVGYLVATLNGWAKDVRRVQVAGAAPPTTAAGRGQSFLDALDAIGTAQPIPEEDLDHVGSARLGR